MKKIGDEIPHFLRDKQVANRLSISRSHVWNLVKQGKLPKPIKISEKITVWRSTDIFNFIENQVA